MQRWLVGVFFMLCIGIGWTDERGIASEYGFRDGFQGQRTASGTRFNTWTMTAAHKTLPFGMMVEVVNLGNGKRVIVTIIDRGPYVRSRVIDLSHKAMLQLTSRGGLCRVRIHVLSRPRGKKR